MDPWQEHAIANLRSRHEDKIRESAERISEYIGYVLRDLDTGRTSSHYAGNIVTDAQTIVTRFAMLEAMGDVTGILASGEPGEEGDDG